MKYFQRSIEPTGDVLEFNLYDDVVHDFHGLTPRLEAIEEWIDRGEITLHAIGLEHYLTDEDHELLRDSCFRMVGGGSDDHRLLIATAWLYLQRAEHPNACRKGSSGCAYAGGWADLCIPGEEYFVECGTLHRDKPNAAMAAGQTLLIIPYENPRLFSRFRGKLTVGYELRPKGKLRSDEDLAAEAALFEKRRGTKILCTKEGRE